MKLNNAAAATSGIISGMTTKVRNTVVKRLVSRNASANSSEHEAGHYGAECVRRIVPRGSREVWIGKETAIIVETERVLAREPPDHEGFAEHPQHRPIGERGKENDGRPQQADDRQPRGPSRREAAQHETETGERRFLFGRA